jgi:hypothetical protein
MKHKKEEKLEEKVSPGIHKRIKKMEHTLEEKHDKHKERREKAGKKKKHKKGK